MTKLLNFIRVSWNLKINLWKCRMFNKSSEEYRLAKYYQDTLNNLKHSEKDIQELSTETKELQKQYSDRKEIINLLKSVIVFLKCYQTIEG